MLKICAVLFRRKGLILTVFLLVLAGATAWTLLMPKKYESQTMLLVKPGVIPDSPNAVAQGDVGEAAINSEIELLSSAEILRQVTIRNGLAADEARSSDASPNAAIERASRKLAKDLQINPVRKASIIHITYTSDDPAKSAAVLRTLTDVYLDVRLRVHRPAGARDFFKTQMQQYENQLAIAEGQFAEFRQQRGVVLMAEQKDLILRRVVDTEAALNETTASLKEAESRIQQLNRQLSTLGARVVTQSRTLPNQYSVERLHTMLAELRNRRTDLLTKFRPEDRLVTEVEQQIADTSAALETAQALTSVEETTDVNPLHQSLKGELARAELALAGLEARQRTLTAARQSWRGQLARLDGATTEHDAMNREIQQAEENLLLYTKKQEEARINDLLDQQKFSNVVVAEAPVEPYLPSKPNVPLNLALGFLLACFASVGTAFALEMNRTTFETAKELQLSTNLPVLATVPVEGQ